MSVKLFRNSAIEAFALVYVTFFLDNVLLTVLVPIIPDWVRGEEAMSQWSAEDAPLARLLNRTIQQASEDGKSVGASAYSAVGIALGAKAAAQLCTAPAAAALVTRRGPALILKLATSTLAVAAIVLSCCGLVEEGAVCAGFGRGTQGAGAALAGVSGLALVSTSVPSTHRDRAIAALLGAVALGVLVGYGMGGVSSALRSNAAPFVIIAVALLATLAMQSLLLDQKHFHQMVFPVPEMSHLSPWGMIAVAKVEATGTCAGAILLTTCVMASLEPTLPLWITYKFHPERWWLGAVFVPDSIGYLTATTTLGGVVRCLSPETLALTGQIALAVAAIYLPFASSVGGLAGPHLLLGFGLGAVDAALVPALLQRHPHSTPHVAALLQAASSTAYAIGPVLGGIISWWCGFESLMRLLGFLNLVYAVLLYVALVRNPLSTKWGACTPDEDSAGLDSASAGEYLPLR